MQQLKTKIRELEELVSQDLTSMEQVKEVRDSLENLLLQLDQVPRFAPQN